ncbi:MAG: radical SAM protein [Sedimentisphaerales bacterium]|jgi:putative pyruvate formate lyase activating enzyme
MNPVVHKQACSRAKLAKEAMRNCRLCPRNCGVDRTAGQKGYCKLDDSVRFYREVLYSGEEADLNPSHHIYFAGCNLRCEFCTVAEWNERPDAADVADMDNLKKVINQRARQGARTLNLLGGEPAVNVYGILKLFSCLAAETKVVWNSNMYYNGIVDELMAGLVDVYLADFKVGEKRCAESILGAADYLEVVKKNIIKAGTHGRVIVRHVILPGHTECCLKPILRWLAETLPAVEVSLRGNYFPPANAGASPAGYLSGDEFQKARQFAAQYRLNLVK